jgi:hypothetical protein
MPIAELMPMIKALPREEKWQLMRFLTNELEHEGESSTDRMMRIPSDTTLEFWSPFDASEIGTQLTELLAK